MPDRHVLHIADAFALGGLGEHHEWLCSPWRPVTASKIGRRVVAVDLGRLPAEGARTSRPADRTRDACRRCARGSGSRCCRLKATMLEQPERRRHHRRFPGRAFLHLAVAEHGVDDAVGFACRVRPAPCRPPWTDRGRASRSRPRCPDCRSRDGQPSRPLRFAVSVEILAAENAEILEDHVLDHAAVALRHQEGVGRRAVGIAPHQPVIDAVDDLGAGIRRADMQAPAPAAKCRGCAFGSAGSVPCRLDIEGIASNHFVQAAVCTSLDRQEHSERWMI